MSFLNKCRDIPELQAALIRLGIWIFAATYIGLGSNSGYYAVNNEHYVQFFGAFFIVFVGILISILRRPIWIARRYFSLVVDVAATCFSIHLTQDAIGPFYLLFIWIFISYGTRYGVELLRAASMVSAAAYAVVLAVLGQWETHTFEAVFMLSLLLILPKYQILLLNQLDSARQEAEKSRMAAEKANKAKSDFLATMTHELRTPLSGVIGMTRLMESTPLSCEQKDYVDSITASAHMLQALIGDVLDLSKIDAEKLQLENLPFRLKPTVEQVCTALSSQAFDKGLDLIFEYDDRLPDEVTGDELRIRQILFNLLGNAVKFTEHGQIIVRVSLAEANNDIGYPHVLMDIEDSGIGIPQDKLDDIFESFWQADISTTRQYGGTGLGTTIANKLTHMMKGYIGAESEQGQGSRFWVRLPLLPMDYKAVSPIYPTDCQGMKVLVYEKNPAAQLYLQKCCAALGVEAHFSSEADQLTTAISNTTNENTPEVILLADSPQSNDLESLTILVKHLCGDEQAILYLTYGKNREIGHSGSSSVLSKPFSLEQLHKALLLGKTRQATPIETAPAEAEPKKALESRPHILVAEDNAISAKVLNTFLQKADYRSTVVNNGQDALDKAKQEQYQMAFIDLRMPKMDGLEFTRQLREWEAQGDQRLPIVLLTANASEEIKSACLEAGMDGILSKPVDPEQLVSIVEKYCR